MQAIKLPFAIFLDLGLDQANGMHTLLTKVQPSLTDKKKIWVGNLPTRLNLKNLD